jgi:hypothetical protein
MDTPEQEIATNEKMIGSILANLEFDSDSLYDFTPTEYQLNQEFSKDIDSIATDFDSLGKLINSTVILEEFSENLMLYAIRIALAHKNLFALKKISKQEKLALKELSEIFTSNSLDELIDKAKEQIGIEKK